MRVDVEVNSFFEHRTRVKKDVPQGAIATDSDQGEEFARVREVRDEPSVTSIQVGDESIDQMHSNHLDAVRNAAGAVPEKSRRRVLADHLTHVLGHHAPSGAIHKVHVLPDGVRGEAERKALEKFLNRILVDDDDDDLAPLDAAPEEKAEPSESAEENQA